MTGKWTPGPTRETGQGRARCGDSRGERRNRLGFTPRRNGGQRRPRREAANRGHQRSLCHLEATMSSGDACHSVPDSPRPGTWSRCSGANFPSFPDELPALPHPACFLTSVSETHARTSTTVGRRPRGGAPSPPCPLAFEPKAKRPPVSPGEFGTDDPYEDPYIAVQVIAMVPWSRRDRRNGGGPGKKAPGFTPGSPCPTGGSPKAAPPRSGSP